MTPSIIAAIAATALGAACAAQVVVRHIPPELTDPLITDPPHSHIAAVDPASHSAEPSACDCDTSTGPGVCDVFDFLCFQNAFAAGCP